MSWHHDVNFVTSWRIFFKNSRDVKKLVSSWHQKYVMMTKSASWRPKKYIITPKICPDKKVCLDVKNTSWRQKYVIQSKFLSWHRKYVGRQKSKYSSWRSTIEANIVSHIWYFSWPHYLWPWMTFRGQIKYNWVFNGLYLLNGANFTWNTYIGSHIHVYGLSVDLMIFELDDLWPLMTFIGQIGNCFEQYLNKLHFW